MMRVTAMAPSLRRVQARNASTAVYSYGKGFLGSLGTGSYDDVVAPTPLPSMEPLAIEQLSVGWAHAGFVTADGAAYYWGRTHSFRDVIRATNMNRLAPWLLTALNSITRRSEIDMLTPTRIVLPEGERVKKMVCSTALTLLLTESGKLFATGANGYGQCGTGVESVSVAVPEAVNVGGGETVVDIAGGYQHGLAVTAEGNVYAWGKGERGQLGFGSANVSSPQEVIALRNRKVVAVDAGFNHSTALTADGELFLWGKLLNPKGKEEGMGDQVTPRIVKTREPVRLAACSHFHTTFITGDERVWIIGRTPSGRKEMDDRLVQVASEMHTTPFHATNTDALDISSVTKLGKGIDNTFFVTKEGQAFEWTFTGGIQRLAELQKLRVSALEGGFRYRVVLGEQRP
ncbi:hypothetical protein ATCC90586_010263 [Pythium insidiosum]|nr:hypothetical protein ATCC90586_010263 [Pythium insidiosum]